MDFDTSLGHAGAMDQGVGVTKTISLETRDFRAETWAKDGTRFHIKPFSNRVRDEVLESWWLAHRHDNHRGAFAADDGEYHLECFDETEALSLLLNLQREFNRSLP